MSDLRIISNKTGTGYIANLELEETKRKLALAEADFKQAATNSETNSRLLDDALRRLSVAEARVKELEGLPVHWIEAGNHKELLNVLVPSFRFAGSIKCQTLGEAMPRKDQ